VGDLCLELKNLAFDPHEVDTKREELHRSPLELAYLLDRHFYRLGSSCFLQTVYKEWKDFVVLNTDGALALRGYERRSAKKRNC
jgi:hypothetical protein